MEHLLIVAIVLSPLLVMAWVNLFYLIFNKNKEFNQELSILAMVSLYMFSLVPMGVFIGFYLANRKLKIDNIEGNKYASNIRKNGELILIISIASSIFSLINLIR